MGSKKSAPAAAPPPPPPAPVPVEPKKGEPDVQNRLEGRNRGAEGDDLQLLSGTPTTPNPDDELRKGALLTG